MRLRFFLFLSLSAADFLSGLEDGGRSIFPINFGPSSFSTLVATNSGFRESSLVSCLFLYLFFLRASSSVFAQVLELTPFQPFYSTFSRFFLIFFFGRFDFIDDKSILPKMFGPFRLHFHQTHQMYQSWVIYLTVYFPQPLSVQPLSLGLS